MEGSGQLSLVPICCLYKRALNRNMQNGVPGVEQNPAISTSEIPWKELLFWKFSTPAYF